MAGRELYFADARGPTSTTQHEYLYEYVLVLVVPVLLLV